MNTQAQIADRADPPAFQPFTWLDQDAKKIPGAKLAERTRDLSQGIAMVLEMVEQDGLANDCADLPRLMTLGQRGTMLRFAIAAAESLADMAEDQCAWFDNHGRSAKR